MPPETSAGACMQALVAAIRGPRASTETGEAFSQLLRRHGVSEDDANALQTRRANVRFGLYRDLVRNRFRNALELSIPRTLARAGSRIEADLDAFLALRASRSPYFRDVAREFVDFVVELWQPDPSVPGYLHELARHELLSFEIAASEDDPRPTSGLITVQSRLRFQGAARLVRYRYAVHLLPEGDDAIAPDERRCSLLAYRDRRGNVLFLELSALGATLLARLTRGEPLGRACTSTLADLAVSQSDGVLAEIAVLLDDLERRGVLLGPESERFEPERRRHRE